MAPEEAERTRPVRRQKAKDRKCECEERRISLRQDQMLAEINVKLAKMTIDALFLPDQAGPTALKAFYVSAFYVSLL
jgi:hypothetical protein